MSNNTSIDQADLVNEAVTLMSFTTVVAVLYTFSFVLYCLCARLLYLQLRGGDGKRRTVLAFAFASVVIICATIDVALSNQHARIMYVDYGSLSSGGPLGDPAQDRAWTILQLDGVVDLVGQFLTLGVLLWRVWVIYMGTRFATVIKILSLLLYLTYVVSYTLQVALSWAPLAGTLPKITKAIDIVNDISLSAAAASAIIMAIMIATRLVLVRHNHIKLMGKTDAAAQYLGIAAMLIESYTLTSIWNIGYLIAYVLKNPPAHNFFGTATQQVEFLSYFLILYRVFSGRAWDRQTRNKLSTMRWDRGTTQPTVDGMNTRITDIRASYIDSNPRQLTSRADV